MTFLFVVGFFLLASAFESSHAHQNWNEIDRMEGDDADESSRCPSVRERRAWDTLSCHEQDAFLTNIRRLKANGIYDAFVRVHIENERVAHGTAEFLPWHRWFIYQFESAIRSVADPPYKCMSLPFWDWGLDAGNEGVSSVLSLETFSSFEGTTRNGRCRFPINYGDGAGSCLRRRLNFDFPFWGEGRIVALIRGYSQYGDDFPNDRTRVNGFRAALEGGPHAAPHNFIGGSMIDQNAANDPLFWIHHANVDRIWSMWQDYHGHTDVALPFYSVPKHYEGPLMDVPMTFPFTRFWDFRIRNLRGPTPREVLSNNGVLLSVRYVHNNPMPSESRYISNRQWFGTPPLRTDQCYRMSDRNSSQRRNQQRASENEEDSANGETRTKPNIQNTHLHGLRGFETSYGKNLSIFPSQSTIRRHTNSREIISVEECLKSNNFYRPQDRQNWNALCRELPDTHANLKDRLNYLALQDCKELGNPQSAMDNGWIERMNMSSKEVVFECYHTADENERPSS